MIIIEFIYYKIYRIFKGYDDDPKFKSLLIVTLLVWFNILEILGALFLFYEIPKIEGEMNMFWKIIIGACIFLIILINYFLLMKNDKTEDIEKKFSNQSSLKTYFSHFVFILYVTVTLLLLLLIGSEVRNRLF